jgi:hypothetical protein
MGHFNVKCPLTNRAIVSGNPVYALYTTTDGKIVSPAFSGFYDGYGGITSDNGATASWLHSISPNFNVCNDVNVRSVYTEYANLHKLDEYLWRRLCGEDSKFVQLNKILVRLDVVDNSWNKISQIKTTTRTVMEQFNYLLESARPYFELLPYGFKFGRGYKTVDSIFGRPLKDTELSSSILDALDWRFIDSFSYDIHFSNMRGFFIEISKESLIMYKPEVIDDAWMKTIGNLFKIWYIANFTNSILVENRYIGQEDAVEVYNRLYGYECDKIPLID